MKVNLISVGKKQPDWINHGFSEYAKRLRQEVSLQLIEVSAVTKSKNISIDEVKQKEADRIRAAIPKDNQIITLDEQGRSLSSVMLSKQLESWLNSGRDTSLIIGGADGLDKPLLQQADDCWSLSAFTLPHGLARIIIAEQIYRAWSILKCHPYHRS